MTTPIYPPNTPHWTHRYPERVARGTAAAGAKLSQADIDTICEMKAAGVLTWRVARRFEIDRRTVQRYWKARQER